jgi:hypothetical protein
MTEDLAQAKAIVAQLTERRHQAWVSTLGCDLATEINNERITTHQPLTGSTKLADELLADGSEDLTDTTLAGNPRKTPQIAGRATSLGFFDDFYAFGP